jgi:gliding motility-associated-like protein
MSKDTVRIEFVCIPSVYVGEDRSICGNTDVITAQDGNTTGGWWTAIQPSPTIYPVENRTATVTAIPGTYDFVWYAYNNSTSDIQPARTCPSSDTVRISFWEKPTALITTPLEDSVQCGRENICGVLKADPPGSGITGYWRGATGVRIDEEFSPSDACIVSVPLYRTYEFEWIEYVNSMPQNFCADTARYSIRFIERPRASAGNDTLFCGSRGMIHATPSIGNGYWRGGIVTFDPENAPSTLANCDVYYGTYDLIWIEDNGYSCTDSDTMKVTFAKLPTAEVNIIPAKCRNSSAIITAEETENTVYSWTLDGGAIDSSRYNSLGGEYMIFVSWDSDDETEHRISLETAIRVGTKECASLREYATVEEAPQPEWDLLIAADTCSMGRGGVVLNPTESNTQVTYRWINDTLGIVNDNVITGLDTGYYDIEVQYLSLNSEYHYYYSEIFGNSDCLDTIIIEIEPSSMIDADILLSDINLDFDNLVVPVTITFQNLTDTDGARTRCEWHFGDGSSVERNCDEFVQHEYTTPGSFRPYLVVMNRDIIACRDTARLEIEIGNGSSIEIPNVFTPNGDQINDYFQVNAESLRSFEGKILNRWGNKMYEWTDWENKTTGGWNGKINNTGQEAAPGVYYYIIKAEGLDGIKYDFKGFLHLFRE